MTDLLTIFNLIHFYFSTVVIGHRMSHFLNDHRFCLKVNDSSKASMGPPPPRDPRMVPRGKFEILHLAPKYQINSNCPLVQCCSHANLISFFCRNIIKESAFLFICALGCNKHAKTTTDPYFLGKV